MNSHNINMINTVLKGLDSIKDEVTFVGGSVLELYIDDTGMEKVRVTDDVDIVIEICTRAEYDEFESKLRKLGFINDKTGPSCRMLYEEIKVDIISTKESSSGITNKWYESGFEKRIIKSINGNSIYVFPVEYFIASKFEAYIGRGNKNYITSHDIEDIIYIFNGSNNITDIILSSDTRVQEYIKDELKEILKDNNLDEIILAHCANSDRKDRIIAIFQSIVE